MNSLPHNIMEITTFPLDNTHLYQFKKIHTSKTAILFGCGPSLLDYIPPENENEYITFAVKQSIVKINHPTYYLFGDKNERSISYENYILNSKATKFCVCAVRSLPHPAHYSYDECIKFNAIPIMIDSRPFRLDITHNIQQSSSIHVALNIILYMDIRKIILVGCDSSDHVSFIDQRETPGRAIYYQNLWRGFKKTFEFLNVTYITYDKNTFNR